MTIKTALVTGGSGFLGRHMCATLTSFGYLVTAFDRYAFGEQDVSCVDAHHWFRHDHTRYDVVVHCAAVVGGREKIDNDPLAIAQNLPVDAELFSWAVRTKQKRVVYISSSAVYPVTLQSDSAYCGLREAQVTLYSDYVGVPDQLYGWSKLMGERMADQARKQGVAVTVVRPFSGYGEDQSPDYPFGAFTKRARERQDPFVVWGDGSQIRDWIHVGDICAAIMTLIDREYDGNVNLGTGRGISMARLAKMFCDTAGYSPAFEFQLDKPTGVAYRVADVTKLDSLYTPQISLEEGVRRALQLEVSGGRNSTRN